MRIAILGAGKMGSWFARVLAADHEVAIYDTDMTKLQNLEGVKELAMVEDIGQFNPELLLNAVNLQCTTTVFEQAEPQLSPSCMLCDITSIKAGLEEYYKISPFKFVSLHPMFGPTFADMASLKEEAVIIMRESDREGAQIFIRLFEGLGIRIFWSDFARHDEMMAYSLTLPFVSSMAFAACVNGKAVPGTTFARHMSVARGLLSEDDHLLAEILFNSYSVAQVEHITARLEHLKHIIKGRDYEEIETFLGRLRDNLP
jgi:prephenate dehydrogenase